jgi:hypothetical protein
MGKLKLVLLLFLGLLAMRTFWGSEFYDGHDAPAHLVRLWQFDKEVKAGHLPPRWAPDLYAGRGYPVFIFVYPLPYFIAEGFHLAGFSLAASLKLTLVLAYLTSLIGMHYLAGFLGAVLWGVAPYMFVKIFITGSLGVVTAFALIPWFFGAISRRQWLTAAVLLALWILSHPGKLVIFAPLLLVFFLQDLKFWRQWLAAGLLAVGLSAWYFLPANLEIPYTHYREFVSHNYVNDFVPFSRLLYSPWGTNAPGFANPLSQQVGIAQWLAVLLGLIFFKKLWPYLLVFALSIFLMLEQSKFIWDLPTPLQQVATPWRFLALAVFSSALIGSRAGQLIKPKTWRFMVVGLLVVLALYGNRNHMRLNDKRVYDQTFLNSYTGVATGWNEHLPIWVKTVDYDRPGQPPPGQLNILYYPGWEVKVDGVKVPIWPSDNGLIQFASPSAGAKIETEFTDTHLRRWSKIISGLSLLFMAGYYLRHRFNYVIQVFLAHVRVKR